jgi:hypothetical protein
LEIRNTYEILIRKPNVKRCLARARHSFKNIMMDLKEILESMDWIYLIQ